MKLTKQLQDIRDTTMQRMPKSIIKTFEDGIEEINHSGMNETRLQVGDTLPDFALLDQAGNAIKWSDLEPSEYTVFNFYRGGWCPYCNLELRAYEGLLDAFKEAHAQVVAVSAENPTRATQTKQKNVLSFPVLTDQDAAFMKAIGIVFELNAQTQKDYEGFGMDFTEIHGNENYELPVPAVYVVNKKREIIFTHFEADYMTRIEPDQVLTSIRQHTNAQKQFA